MAGVTRESAPTNFTHVRSGVANLQTKAAPFQPQTGHTTAMQRDPEKTLHVHNITTMISAGQ